MKPVPGPLVMLVTIFAPKSRSFALVVVTAPLLLDVLLPVFAAVTSTGLLGSAPLYSRIRMSAYVAAVRECDRNGISTRCCGCDVLRVIDRLRQRAADRGGSHRQRIGIARGVDNRANACRRVIPTDYDHVEVASCLLLGKHYLYARLRRLWCRVISLNVADNRSRR